MERELVARRIEEGWEVLDGDAVFGVVGDPRTDAQARCVARGGDWQFTRLRGGHVEATMGTAVVARYESKLMTGGTIALPDDSRFRLARPVLGDTWRLRRGRRDVVLEVAPQRVGWSIHLKPQASELQQLSLVTLLAFHAVLTELDRPTAVDGPPVPS